jgi:O-antigen ligase
MGIALLILAVFYLFTFTEVYQNIQFRFENSDLTTGRSDLFVDYMNFMGNHPEKMIFGLGLQYTNLKAGLETVPRNAFLETYVCLGIVGLIAAICLVCNLFYLFRRRYILVNQRKPKFLNYIPFFIYLFFIQTFQFIKIGYIFVPIALVFLCILVPYRTQRGSDSKWIDGEQKELSE